MNETLRNFSKLIKLLISSSFVHCSKWLQHQAQHKNKISQKMQQLNRLRYSRYCASKFQIVFECKHSADGAANLFCDCGNIFEAAEVEKLIKMHLISSAIKFFHFISFQRKQCARTFRDFIFRSAH